MMVASTSFEEHRKQYGEAERSHLMHFSMGSPPGERSLWQPSFLNGGSVRPFTGAVNHNLTLAFAFAPEAHRLEQSITHPSSS